MSKTLFWYLFKDLVRIFAMASGALAGIMSFAGLLRPLTENGLDLGQVSRILRYMSPAMTTYSLPVAALFATTMVYGRFSSDNELTAMRAGGISYLSARRFSIALPALVLGLLAAVVSLLLLCFIVPVYSLKVEEVIYSNIAKVISSKIEKNHEIEFRGSGEGETDVFAQEAHLVELKSGQPGEQAVELIGPAIMTYETPDPATPNLRVPKDFWMASKALVRINRIDPQAGNGAANLLITLTDGIRFPREFEGNVQAGVALTTFGPLELPSMINENVKFLDVGRLRELGAHPARSEKVQTVLREITRREEEELFLGKIAAQINRRDNTNDNGIQAHATMLTAAVTPAESDSYTVAGDQLTARQAGSELILTAADTGDGRTVRFHQAHGSQLELQSRSREIHIHARADVPNRQMAVSIEMYDTEIKTFDVISDHMSFQRSFYVPMTPDILAIESKPLKSYSSDPLLKPVEGMFLRHEQIVVKNAVYSELHSRASFAISCLVLVMVGRALGVMFRSGNFLTAFAVSFVPALLVITLIVCGQQIATHVPYDMGHIRDPLNTAIWFIWIGNIAVLGTAVYLTMKLQKR